MPLLGYAPAKHKIKEKFKRSYRKFVSGQKDDRKMFACKGIKKFHVNCLIYFATEFNIA